MTDFIIIWHSEGAIQHDLYIYLFFYTLKGSMEYFVASYMYYIFSWPHVSWW